MGLGEMSVGATPLYVAVPPLPLVWPGLDQIFITELLGGSVPTSPAWAPERKKLEAGGEAQPCTMEGKVSPPKGPRRPPLPQAGPPTSGPRIPMGTDWQVCYSGLCVL